jgi:hypothetical protein
MTAHDSMLIFCVIPPLKQQHSDQHEKNTPSFEANKVIKVKPSMTHTTQNKQNSHTYTSKQHYTSKKQSTQTKTKGKKTNNKQKSHN